MKIGTFLSILLLGITLVPVPAPAQAREADPQRQLEKAMKLYNQATQTVQKAKSSRELERAAGKYEQALGIFEELGFEEGVYRVVNNLGTIHLYLSNYPKATEYFEKSLGISRKLGDAKGESAALNNLGGVHSALFDHEKALAYFQQALDIRKRVGDPAGESESNNNLGTAYAELGKYSEAVKCYENAFQVAKGLQDLKSEATALNNLGNLHKLRGQYSDAVESYKKSLEIKEKLEDPRGLALTLQNLGTVFFDRGEHTQALEYYQKALETKKKFGDLPGQGDSYLLIGEVHEHKGDNKEALKAYEQGLELYKQAGVSTKRPSQFLGHLYLDLGEIDKAEPFIKDTGDKGALGRLNLVKGLYKRAFQDYQELRREAEKSGDVVKLFTAYTGLGKASELLEEYEKAEDYYWKGMTVTEKIRAGLLPAERKNFFDVKINGFYRAEPAKGLTRVRMKLNRSAQSVLSSEVTRARSFADKLSGPSEKGFTGVPDSVLKKEEELVTRLATLNKKRMSVSKTEQPDLRRRLDGEIKQAQDEFDRFVETLWKDYKAYAAVKYPRPVKLADSALRPNEYVIIYDVLGDGVGIKLIKGRKIISTFYRKWDVNDLTSHILKFREPFEKVEFQKFDTDLAKLLYQKLLGPLASEIPEHTPLIIVPDGILAMLPFEALVTGGKPTWKKGKWAVYPDGLTYVEDMYDISYYQSITALTLARQEKKEHKPGERLLVMADPVFSLDDPRLDKVAATKDTKMWDQLPTKLMSIKEEAGVTLPRLPLTGELGEFIKELFPDATDLYTGVEANRSKLLGKPLDRYKHIVFATHGYYGQDLPGIKEPVLALTMLDQGDDKGGFLMMTEVMALKLNADLVALTACQTGLGKNVSGEGVMGMGRAFQYAGARSALMSLWSVAEQSSVELVKDFFKHLKQGEGKLVALRSAREELRKSGFEHPFFWAAFILSGETD